MWSLPSCGLLRASNRQSRPAPSDRHVPSKGYLASIRSPSEGSAPMLKLWSHSPQRPAGLAACLPVVNRVILYGGRLRDRLDV